MTKSTHPQTHKVYVPAHTAKFVHIYEPYAPHNSLDLPPKFQSAALRPDAEGRNFTLAPIRLNIDAT